MHTAKIIVCQRSDFTFPWGSSIDNLLSDMKKIFDACFQNTLNISFENGGKRDFGFVNKKALAAATTNEK